MRRHLRTTGGGGEEEEEVEDKVESGAVMQRSRDACNAISNYTNCPIVQKEQDGVLRS